MQVLHFSVHSLVASEGLLRHDVCWVFGGGDCASLIPASVSESALLRLVWTDVHYTETCENEERVQKIKRGWNLEFYGGGGSTVTVIVPSPWKAVPPNSGVRFPETIRLTE